MAPSACLHWPFLLLSVLLVAPHVALAGVQEVWWNVSYATSNPDGLFSRRVVGVNGTWPPPILEVNNTDSLVVHVTNSLSEPTTLHHHGMFFNSTSWMDGAMGVSQCGIPPGQTFDYHIPINSSGQWGTYWAHAHAHGQYVDGLRTPFIIHPPAEHYAAGSKTKPTSTYDEEFTVVLGDWYHDEHSVLLDRFISISNPGGAEPVPDSGLIYFAKGSNFLAPTTGSGSVGFNENATLPFEAGKTHRLRIVNTGAFGMFHFWIDGHDMRVIEVDGTDIEEFPVDFLGITVAQRYSILVTARNDTTNATNWAIHANFDTDMFDTVPDSLQPNITSSITYSSSFSLTDLGPVDADAYDVVDDVNMVPIEVIPQLPAATKRLELEFEFDTLNDGTNHALFNGITYNPPNTPAILSELTLADNATVEAAYGPLSFVVDHLEVFDIVLKNADAGKHPFHLHGHKMQLVHRTDDYTDNEGEVQEGQANPMRRDTVHVPSGGEIVLRVVADNPGVWFFHCHIEFHLTVGLAVQIIEAPLIAQARTQSPLIGTSSGFTVPNTNISTPFYAVPQDLYDQCQALSRPISGNAAGHASTTDLSGLQLGPFPQNNGWHPKGIGAMAGCMLSAVLGMATVVWYSLGAQHEEVVDEGEKRKWYRGWRK